MNLSDLKRNAYMLRGSDAKRGYILSRAFVPRHRRPALFLWNIVF